MNRNLVSILLAATLSLSLFPACSQQKSPEDPSRGSTDTPTSSQYSTPAPSSGTASPAMYELTVDEQNMLAVIDNNKDAVYEIEKKIWEYQELGMDEFKSSNLSMDMLESEGFTVQRGITGKDIVNGVDADVPTGFVATYEGKGKGATDVGNVAYKIPTVFAWFPTAEEQPTLQGTTVF